MQQPMHYQQGPPQPHMMQMQMQPPLMNYQNVEKQQLDLLWQNQRQEIDQVTDFKTHQLPLARIKKIMKADEDVKMIAAEAPVVFAKASEMFILELTLRSWMHTEENKRRTLQKNDIAASVARADIFDFLLDIVPREEKGDEESSWSNGLSMPESSMIYGGQYYPAAMGQPVMGQQPAVGQVPMNPYMGAQQPS
ncbi:unnamed protein product [Calypogeia fissa]